MPLKMLKTNSLKILFETKRFTTHNRFQYNSHRIEMKTFIFDISKDLFP